MKKDNKTMLSSFEQFTSKNAKILWGVLAVILIALPFVVKNQYFLTVVAKIGCYAILGLGLNILTGYTGLVSLGHAGFVAIGAYTASLLAVTLGWSFFPAMLAGMLLAARDIYGGITWIRENKDEADIAKLAEKAKKNFAGTEIQGKTLGVIGLGAIGVWISMVLDWVLRASCFIARFRSRKWLHGSMV